MLATPSPASCVPRSARPLVLTIAWIALLGGSMTLLARYHGREGDPGETPVLWPASEPRLAPSGLEAMIFVHPRCPCTLRSIDALSALQHHLLEAGIDCMVHVVIRAPADDPDDEAWTTTPAHRRLARLGPHVQRLDPGGSIARRWGAITSGHVAIFDARGRRLLDGGLTPARAHAEDPAVLRALAHQLARGTAIPARPVFGCPIPDAGPGEPSARSTPRSTTMPAGATIPADHDSQGT